MPSLKRSVKSEPNKIWINLFHSSIDRQSKDTPFMIFINFFAFVVALWIDTTRSTTKIRSERLICSSTRRFCVRKIVTKLAQWLSKATISALVWLCLSWLAGVTAHSMRIRNLRHIFRIQRKLVTLGRLIEFKVEFGHFSFYWMARQNKLNSFKCFKLVFDWVFRRKLLISISNWNYWTCKFEIAWIDFRIVKFDIFSFFLHEKKLFFKIQNSALSMEVFNQSIKFTSRIKFTNDMQNIFIMIKKYLSLYNLNLIFFKGGCCDRFENYIFVVIHFIFALVLNNSALYSIKINCGIPIFCLFSLLHERSIPRRVLS